MNTIKQHNAFKPFWSWNDRLNKDELCSQINAMKKAEINGFFMHARGGLETEYMSEEWFDCIEACLNEADKLDMEAWAYDENGWPSGFASGKVPKQGMDFQQKMLEFSIVDDKEKLPDGLIGLYKQQGDRIVQLETAENECIAVYYKANKYYIDTFNSECIAYFIDCTHERYYERFKERFGSSLKGFFTDEPQFGVGNSIPWSQVFPDYFYRKYGYELIHNLPMLFIDTDESIGFRFDYYNMASELFRNSFIKQMYDWCTEHNCKLTGHMMNEENLFSQTVSTGGVMSCYEYFHEPGIDWLGRKIGNPLVPKQLGSVAAQLGKKTISESFGLCGWDVSLNELKWISQWQYVNGVTSLCPHLEGYSLRGSRKRDYPASLFVQLPWFEKAYSRLTNYFSKLGSILDGGIDNSPLLVLHPMQSAYVLRNPNCNTELLDYARQFEDITQALCDNHILHHYGDECIIEHYGSCTGDRISIGKCMYKAVLLPNIITLTQNTADLLLEFAQNGGQIFYIGKMPERINGRKSETAKKLSALAKRIEKVELLKTELVSSAFAYFVTEGKENSNIQFCTRIMPNHEMIYYAVNLSDKEQLVDFSVCNDCFLSNWDIENDSITPLEKRKENGKTYFTLKFAPYGSLILKNSIPKEEKHFERIDIKFDNIFKIENCSPNAITLDSCEYRIDKGEWQPEKAVIILQRELLERRSSCKVDMKFHFTVDDMTSVNNLKLCMESPEKCSFKINGKEFLFSDNGYYIDKSIRTASITPYITQGKNEIIVSTEYYQRDEVYHVLCTPGMHETEINKLTLDTELESIYIIGDFTVNMKEAYTYGEHRCIYGGKNFSLTGYKNQINISKITEQGYWFFSGEIKLTQKITINKSRNTRYFVKLKKLNAPATELFVNGKNAGVFAFAPYELDITEFVLDGENTVSFNIMSGNRNLLGPHHKPCGESYSVGPATFTDKPGWSDPKDVPCWTDNYNFVLFGIKFF